MIRGIDRAHDIDLGPSSGMHTKGGVFGVIVRPIRAPQTYPSRSPEYRKAHRPAPIVPELCGAWMRNTREFCARRAGHYADSRGYPDHRSRANMDKHAARRHFDPSTDV